MKKKALLALGGNAIIKAGQKGTAEEQFENTINSLDTVVELVKQGYELCLTHGNGPQVGNLLYQQELGLKEGLPALPLGLLNAATEGTMGYMIEQCLLNKLHQYGIPKQVLSILTQVVVDRDDPTLRQPSKFVGSTYYTEEMALKMKKERGWTMKEDSGKGYRRVVPSPIPKEVIPAGFVKKLMEEGVIVVAGGGGGIPVYRDEKGYLKGLDAVIDKDHASALLAKEIGAELFVILTSVEKVSLNYGKEDQRELNELSKEEALRYYNEGQFPSGSMGPKILAALSYLESGGKEVIITSIEKVAEALEGRTGTRIYL